MTKDDLRGVGRVFLRKRRNPKNKKQWLTGETWWVQYYHRGKQIRKSTDTSNHRKAVRFLKDEIEKSLSGRLVVGAAEKLTWKQLSEGLRRDYTRNQRRSLDRAEDGIEHLTSFFGDCRAAEIERSLIDQYVDYRADIDKAAMATVRYEISLLKRMFHLAQNVLGRMPQFPVLQVSNVRKGFFEEAQFLALRNSFEPELRPAITFAYLTGWRIQSEVFSLTWPQVDFGAGEVRLEPGTTKNDEGRTFPFAVLPELEALLREQRKHTEAIQQDEGIIIPWVFHRRGRQIKDMRGAWKQAVETAKIGHRIPHDFRRTAVRNLERAGVPRSVAMRLVGHKTESIYRRYAIVAKSDLVDGLKRLADYRAGMTPAEAKIVPLVREEK